MESIEPVWLFGAMALVTGILFGVLITRLLTPASADVDKLVADLELERAEMESYKASVNTHFDETSELVNELTQDYVKVYKHLAEGAQTLSDTQEFSRVLEQPQGRVLITVADESAVSESVTDESAVESVGESAAETISEEPPVDYVEAQADEDEKVAGGEVADDDANKEKATADADAGAEEVAPTGDVPEGDGQNEAVAGIDDSRDDAREDESMLDTTDPGRQTPAESTEPESTEPESTEPDSTEPDSIRKA